jgi:hypothetical protein
LASIVGRSATKPSAQKAQKPLLIFCEVERTNGIVVVEYSRVVDATVQQGLFEALRSAIESRSTSRWDNPALIAVTPEQWAKFESWGDGEIDQFGKDEDIIVAVTDEDGDLLKEMARKNRIKFGLEGGERK